MGNQGNDTQNRNQADKQQQANIDIRVSLHDAFTFVESYKSAQSFSAFTAEEAHDRFIERVEGRGTPYRPNVIDRIDRIGQNISAVVAKVKAMPDEAFRRHEAKNDVNTKEIEDGTP
jgi:hypothetical protein